MIAPIEHDAPATERLRLRRFTVADEPPAWEMFSDPYARTFYPDMAHAARVREWIEWNLRNYEQFGFGLWAMELRSTGEFIGDCGLTYQDVEDQPVLEIGYHVIERHRSKGYATEAARACLRFGFERTSSDLIGSIVRPANVASCIVAGRIHRARREFNFRGTPAYFYYTTRQDWGAPVGER